MSIIIILGCAMGLFMLTSTEAELNNLFEKRITPIERVLRVQKETLQVRTAILRAILNAQNGESSEADSTAIINIIDEINRQWELANIDESKEEIKKLMATYRDARYQFGADTVYPLIDAINVQDHDQAAMIESISENGYQELESATSNIINYQLISARSEIEDIIKNNNTFKILAIIASSAALIFAVIFSIIIIRGITIPLNRAVNLANHVSKGDLTDTVEARSNDETGQLLTALSSMSEKLRNIVTEIQNDVTVISKGSHDVASSNNNLAESISEQTVSLDLTSSHMNNLVTTNHNAAESASKAHELTEMARREAEQATRVVQDAVNAMNNINESSDRISEITSMIDSIAFQTNLLALNASVEAARAGDQGRGFAVVANEVRNLAQSAAKAAREIRVLIDNSVDSIKSGKELVDKSGKALDNIQNNIENIADIVKTINTASVEQTSGIDEINKAIEEMRAAFKNNSTTVINSAVSSESMAEKVAELMRQISFFNIEKKVDTQSAESTLENKKARLALGKLAPES